MNLTAFTLLAQLAAPMQHMRPILAFPERGLDDSAAYQGYETRLFRDAARNTVQIYLDRHARRIVHLLADAENESVGLTPTDSANHPVVVRWNGDGADVGRVARSRILEHSLIADAPVIHLGSFLLGSMRVERDFQYTQLHDLPFGGTPFVLPEFARLVAAIEQLPSAEQRRHLALLGAADLNVLRARLRPTLSSQHTPTTWTVSIVQPSLDARDTITLVIRTDPRLIETVVRGDTVVLRARRGDRVPFVLRVATTGAALTPLTRREIFNDSFLNFLAAAQARAATSDSASLRARWLERETRGFELLASREKLMAGLPNFATYFGRDMLVSALMMRSIWRPDISELVIASALRKLGPRGDVSHEEALGGQALREAAAEYADLIDEYQRTRRANPQTGDDALRRAYLVLRDARRVRENYHMIDDEFQLPVLTARWLDDGAVSAARKRAFLADSADGDGPRLRRLLRELALVSRMTEAYVGAPVATNLVSFVRLDSTRWRSASWRDSDAGYAGGRFAMDVNAIWAPHALVAMQRILRALSALGVSLDSAARTMPELQGDAPLGQYLREPPALQHAVEVWGGASRHFLVRLGPDDVRSRVAGRLAAMSETERRYWAALPSASAPERDSLSFLALSLDSDGRPIAVANTDPATGLFLDASDPGAAAATGSSTASVLRDVRLFVRPYPVGLLIDRVGPVVANDAYAPPAVWPVFERDQYHGPRVAWGREVNLFLLGVGGMLASHRYRENAPELRDAPERVRRAVEGAGFKSELWSYEIRNGRVMAVRYGTGSDVQLWST
ncbi:MAG TPA: hypothetical protein VGG78_09145, partial [Gemmatimonadaceae bacterium]